MNFGHFVYNQQTYLKKVDALTIADARRDPYPFLSFWFHDDVFSRIDWTIEPTETLEELYLERARQIRAQYDYLILMYSGGSDSHQALDSFIKAGVPVDEVHVVYPFKMMENLRGSTAPAIDPIGLLYEYEHATVPRLKELNLRCPSVKITLSDTTDHLMANYNKDNFWSEAEEVMMTGNFYQSVKVHFQVDDIERRVDEIGKQKVGVVYGADKPNITLRDDNVMSFFTDLGRSAPGLYQKTQSNHDSVLFYWSPDAPKIPIKQAHVLRRALQLSPPMADFLRLNLTKPVNFKESNVVKALIYPSFDRTIFQKLIKNEDDGIISHFLKPDVVYAFTQHFPVRRHVSVVTSRLYFVGKL